jgi:hypothetical protein
MRAAVDGVLELVRPRDAELPPAGPRATRQPCLLHSVKGQQAGPPRGLVSRTALSRVARIGPPELTDLGRAWSHDPDSLALLLRALSPSRRDAFHDAATAGQDLSRSSLAGSLLEALPRRRAHADARRMAAQAAERGARSLFSSSSPPTRVAEPRRGKRTIDPPRTPHARR